VTSAVDALAWLVCALAAAGRTSAAAVRTIATRVASFMGASFDNWAASGERQWRVYRRRRGAT
jgi:hypothetical protein